MSSHPATHAEPAPPLVIGLVRLCRTDVVLEGAFAQLRRRPASAFAVGAWRLEGREALGAKVFAAGAFDPASLPYDLALIDRLRAERERGRKLVLLTGRPTQLAHAVADHLALFDAVVDEAALAHDYPVHEREPSPPPKGRARAALKALRPHQWTKNLLIFIPALLGHSLVAAVWGKAALAFVAFSLCASSVYVLNDLLDLHADRAHPSKRRRPFASGAVPLSWGAGLAPLLLVAAAGIALLLPPAFALVLGLYYAATMAYSLFLKRVVLVDVLVLAGLYTVRIIAGSAAYAVHSSQWLLAFALFIFLSLAFVKRYSEVLALRQKGHDEALGRGYRAGDLEQLATLGSAAGYLSVLVLALYVNSADVGPLYRHPDRLWGLLPLFLYWVSRVWLLAHRGQMHDDPIVFAIRDRVSYLVALLAGLCVLLAI